MGDYCVRQELTKETILSRVSPYDIFRHYIPWFIPNRTILTPFTNESTPSFWSIVRSDGSIWFKDFGRKYSGDCFDLVQILKGCDFADALRHINIDMELGLQGSRTSLDQVRHYDPESQKIPEKKQTIISVKFRDFTEEDLMFWSLHGVGFHTWYNIYGVRPISHYWVNEYMFDAQKLSYRWLVQDRMKIYQPYHPDRTYKWGGNLSYLNVQGHDQLPQKYHTLILQSSLKDSMACYEQFRIPGVSASSETTPIPDEYLDDYERRFDRILVLYDADETGQTNALEICDQRKYENIVLPSEQKATKDPSGMIFHGKIDLLTSVFRDHRLI